MACFHKSKILAILYSVVCLNEVLCSNEVKAVSEGSVKYEGTINIKMPGTRPLKKDTYLCTALQLPPLKQYIVRLEPNATQQTAHHMLLYGCRSPGAQLSSWNCQRGPCNGEQNILYAWAKDAPSRNLPKDVGIGVGGDSGIKYLVLQVHYASATPFKGGAKDFSGFTLHTSQHQLPYEAGIYLLWAGRGSIPPETSGMHVDVGCTYNEPEPMFAFAFRTHAHKLAKVITGYRIRNGVWTLLGKGNPQAPQAFYPMESTIEIKEGDMLAARCTYDSKGHDIQRVIHMGPSGDDEMCNFYIMYYSSAGRLKYSGGDCGQQNHPNVFKNFPPDSDTPLTGSKDLKDRESSVPMISTSAERNTTNPEQTPEKETALVPVSLKVSTDSPTHGKSQGFDISDLGSAKEELPSAKAEVQVGTKPPQELPAFEKSQSVIPVTTSTPVLPVTQSTDEKELRVVLDWPSFTAMETSKLGEVTGVSLDSTGQVVVFHRGSRTWNKNTFDSSHVFQNADIEGTIKEHTVWIIDSLTGKIRGFWGKDMFFLPHGLTVDHEDNLWLTDVGSHQVFKFSPLGRSTKLMLSLGDKLVPGSDRSRFCQPTSVAVDRNGEFFVADGYCNSRILKFSADGKLLSSWGERSLSGPGLPALGSLLIPHSLSLDQSSHTLYVADRENGRVQSISSISGTFVDEIILPEFGGKVFAVDYSVSKQGGVLHVVNGRSQIKGVQNVPVQGFTIRVADKVILQTWPSDEEQALVYPHDVASSVDGSDVYVVEISPNRILKLSSKRQVDSFSNKTSTTPLNIEPAKTGDRVVSQGSHSIPGKSIDEFNPQQGESENTSPKGKSTHRASADPDQLKKYGKDPSLPSVSSTGTIGQSSPNPTETVTVKNNSASGPQDDTSSSDSNVDITAGIIPALIILSVLAVPIVFLLLISITLRVRAYRRDKRNQMSDFHGGRKDFSVGRTRGWWSYMNCFDRQKYKFNRVTLQDFYSDSDSDGV